jgi:spectrin beta
MRDVEDENIWIEEKMNVVTSEEYGNSLQEVNLLIKKNKTMRAEIENHEPRIQMVKLFSRNIMIIIILIELYL